MNKSNEVFQCGELKFSEEDKRNDGLDAKNDSKLLREETTLNSALEDNDEILIIFEKVESDATDSLKSEEKIKLEEDVSLPTFVNKDNIEYKCTICTIGSNEKNRLDEYLQMHRIFHSCECDFCGQKSTPKKSMQRRNVDKPFKCHTCGKPFNNKSCLQKHLLIHTGERPYECKICKKAFRRSDHLQTHIRTHTGERPYKCDICGQRFTQSGSLWCHVKRHTGEKPYKCDTCGKSFFHLCKLKIHIRTHTGEKPHECAVCKKCFMSKNSLWKHSRLHAGKKRKGIHK